MTDGDRRGAGFGAQADFALGVEEELLLVDPRDARAVAHGRRGARRAWATPTRGRGLRAPRHLLGADRARLARGARRRARASPRSAPCARACARRAAPPSARASIPTAPSATSCTSTSRATTAIVEQLQGLIRRTPTCALHVHVGMPDAETAIRVFNGLREHLPLLQALAANSPFWHGRDSGLATRARAALPRLSARRDPARLRLLRRLRRDASRASSRPATCPTTRSCGGTSARTRGWARSRCARWTASRRCGRRPGSPRSSTAWRAPRRRSARDAWVAARGAHGGVVPRRARRAARAAAAGRRAAPRARGRARRARARAAVRARARLGRRARGHRADPREGNGADRQRAAHARGGMPALLDLLVAEAEAPYG